jgi:ribosomal protein S18 acetylase RimI-like enzyme
MSADHKLLGFGQYYVRLNHCHLCRLIVAPSQRGRGLARILIEEIARAGRRASKLKSSSLFVYKDNLAAIKAYEKFGFRVADYPSDDVIENCFYMVTPSSLEANS